MILIRIQQIGQKPDYCLWRFWKNIINLPPPPKKKKKTYDYHTAFDIKPAKVVYNVDLDMNDKKLPAFFWMNQMLIVLPLLNM